MSRTDGRHVSEPTHFLIVGDSTDLPLLRHMLGRLPVDAYGQMFIEVATAVQVHDWAGPDGLAVTWLVRERSRRFRPRGEAAAQAMLAWVSEWMPEDQDAHSAPYVMWIGCSMSTVMDRLYRQLGDRLDHLHLHHPHE